jgi:predicted transcriptional regulator
LTQIGYVDTPPQELEMSPAKDERPEKRRKTMGDAPNSSFHTQTLTQLISELGKDEIDENMLLLSDQEEENQQPNPIDENEGGAKKKGKRKAAIPKKALSHVTDSRAPSMIPQTPVHNKNKKDVYEIPSSQPTPTTPLDLPRYRIQPYRSPLKEKQLNTNATPLAQPTVTKRPRDMVIQDSYSSAGLLSSDPAQTPVKADSASVAASAARTHVRMELGESTSRRGPFAGTLPTEAVPMINNRRVLGEIEIPAIPDREIPDSDEEPESLGPTPVKKVEGTSAPVTPHRAVNAARAAPQHTTPTITAQEEDHVLGCSDDDLVPGSPTPIARRVHAAPQPSQVDLEIPKHAHLGPDDEPAVVSPFDLSPQPEPPRQPSGYPRYRGGDRGANVLQDIGYEHEESLNLPPAHRASVRFYTTRLGPIPGVDEPLVPSVRPVQERTSGRSAAFPSSYNAPQPQRADPPIASFSRSAPEQVSNRSTVLSTSHTASKNPPEVIEILDDTPTASPQVSSQKQQVPAGTRSRSRQGSAPIPAEKEAMRTSPHTSSQTQVPDTPMESRRVRIEVPQHSMEDEILEVTPGTSPQQPSSIPAHSQPTQAKSQYYSQGLESQRVPLEKIRSLGPQTDRTDIVMSIHPGPAELIARGEKTHEFRNYKIPVSRVWLYVTAPVSELRYMATIGPAKEPGEIDNGGAGNNEFNAGRGSKFAHEILQVYLINNPVPLAMIKERGVFQIPPQKYQFLPPAIVGELLGNLRCALFDSQHVGLQPDHDESEPELEPEPELQPQQKPQARPGPDQNLTVSQEIEDQLRSDIILATSQAQPAAAQEPEEVITLSSQSQFLPIVQTSPVTIPKSDDGFARPQVPASQMQRTPLQARFSRRENYNNIRPSQATTASEPSSPVISPEKSVPIQRPFLGSSGPSLPDFVGETQFSLLGQTQHESYDLGSSQVEALPESLLVDDLRPPQITIWDSEDDEDDVL